MASAPGMLLPPDPIASNPVSARIQTVMNAARDDLCVISTVNKQGDVSRNRLTKCNQTALIYCSMRPLILFEKFLSLTELLHRDWTRSVPLPNFISFTATCR